MVQAAIPFLVKSVLCSLIMLGYYWLFLRNSGMHRFNRYYLLSAAVFGIIVPSLHFEWYNIQAQLSPAFQLLQPVNAGPGEQEAAGATGNSIDWVSIFAGVYVLVAVVLMISLVAGVTAVYRLKRRHSVTRRKGFHLVHTQLARAPFSFLNNLFWRNDIDPESVQGRQIMLHELAHIKQRHTWDKLFVQVLGSLCWLNPCYLVIRKELSMTHEFLADEQAIADKNTEAFALMLLQTHYGRSFGDVVHPFFHSSIKRRLTMLNQFKTPKYANLRRFMALPLLTASVVLFSFTVNDATHIRAKERIILAIDAGHGGHDNGAMGSNGTLEKDLCLKITRRMAELAEDYNIEVVPVRKDDHFLPLQERTEIANSSSADVFISVHVNSEGPEKTGKDIFEMVMDERNARAHQSRVLASAIASRLGSMNIKTQLAERHLVVLRNTKMPALLIECGFIDNPRHVDMINSNEQLDAICRNVLGGVVDYRSKY